MKSKAINIEQGTDTPPLGRIIEELEQAQTDSNWYIRRLRQMLDWWQSRWPSQWEDGRKHVDPLEGEQATCFPWDGAADSRVRTVGTIIKEHVMVSKYAFFKAKIQARSSRPLINARDSNKTTKLLQWRLYVHMWAELIREMPFYFNWRWGYGTAFMGVEWEQSRRLEMVPLSLPVLAEIAQAQGADDRMLYLMDAFRDPNQEDQLVELVQALSPIVSKPKARGIVTDLREIGTAELPVARYYVNKPKWIALRPVLDVLIPSETCDLQDSRWVCRRNEWLSETELTDRIETEGYDPGFVKKALETAKGEPGLAQNTNEIVANQFVDGQPGLGSKRDLVEIFTFRYKALMNGTPCLYKTVMNPLVKDTYAKHGVDEYAHGFYPYVVGRRNSVERPILSSVGIAEEAYTDEQAIKAQQDGITDRTGLVNLPAMIVPYSRVRDIKGQRMPGAVIGVSRPNEISWAQLPPNDGTPLEAMKLVQLNLDRRYPLFGMEVDPALKQLYRDEVGQDVLAETSLMADQTLQLMQQYEVEEEVAAVVGPLARPFKVSPAEIRGRHDVSAATDMKMLDPEYAKQKLEMLGQALQFNQTGTANMSKVMQLAMEVIEPDFADLGILDDDQQATQREINEEINAISQAFNGIEAPLPMYGNHQLRLQTLLKTTLGSTNPSMGMRLQQNPDTVEILKKRAQFYMNQIQQHTQNPQIGRALSTQTFQPKMAPELAQPGTQGY